MPNGRLHHITHAVVSSWPYPDSSPTERRWFPPFAISLQALTTIVLVARLWTRFRRHSGRLGIDDLFITLGFGFSVALTVIFSVGTSTYGFNRHAWDIDQSFLERAAFIIWVTTVLFLIASALIKCSVLVFYNRVIGHSCSHVWIRVSWVAIAFTITYTAALVAVAFLICRPMKAYWRTFSPEFDQSSATCLDEHAFWLVGGALAVFSDLYALFIPGLLLWRLRMTRGQRIGLVLIFVLALAAVGAGVARAIFLWKYSQFDRSDLTWLQFPVFVASQAEIQLAIICACAPSLKAFCSETIRVPLQDACRRGSQHLSSSLGPLCRGGTLLRHTDDSRLHELDANGTFPSKGGRRADGARQQYRSSYARLIAADTSPEPDVERRSTDDDDFTQTHQGSPSAWSLGSTVIGTSPPRKHDADHLGPLASSPPAAPLMIPPPSHHEPNDRSRHASPLLPTFQKPCAQTDPFTNFELQQQASQPRRQAQHLRSPVPLPSTSPSPPIHSRTHMRSPPAGRRTHDPRPSSSMYSADVDVGMDIAMEPVGRAMGTSTEEAWRRSAHLPETLRADRPLDGAGAAAEAEAEAKVLVSVLAVACAGVDVVQMSFCSFFTFFSSSRASSICLLEKWGKSEFVYIFRFLFIFELHIWCR